MQNNGSIFKRWIKFVELSTKLVSLTPFFIGTAYSLYYTGAVDWKATGILFVAVFFWSLTVTMVNNFIDRRREGKEQYFSAPVSLTADLRHGRRVHAPGPLADMACTGCRCLRPG